MNKMNKTVNQSTGRKRRFTTKLRRLAMLLGSLALTAGTTFAEGTKEISNNNANTNSALLVYESRSSGPFLNNIQENRIKIRIADFNAEKIYYGFKWQNYAGSAEIGANVWMRIYDPNGNEVTAARQRFNSTTAGYISTFTQGVNGPNILGVSNGYAPLSFTPAMNGEYSMVFYRVTGTGASSSTDSLATTANQQFRSSFWDITVANNTQKFNGRVFSQNWGLVAITSSEAVNASSKAAPSFYSYSHDSTLIKLGFVSTTSGFAPIAYDIAFTTYGVSSAITDWAQSRKSVESATTNVVMANGFKAFLNQPSATLYPIAQISGTPAFGAVPITGCPGSNLTANYTMPEAGDVKIVFDIDGNGDGYTPGTRDFVLEAFNRPAGPGSITWDGKDGLGNNLVQGTAIKISATYRRGRFNLPIYDAEVNADGMYIQTIAPLSSPSNRLYWDDASLPNNQTTGTCSDNNANVTGNGLNNSFIGTVSSLASPTRAWNGNGNLTNIVPAPSVTRGTAQSDANAAQCDDYGNVRVLNTWGWALEADGQLVNVTFGCFNLAGNVYNDMNGKADGLISQSATNPVTLPALYAYLVSSDSVVRAVTTVNTNGTYSFTNIPGASYNMVISSTALAVNPKLNYATQITLPAGWNYVGEQVGTTANAGVDTTADGILAIVLDANKTNHNFGIQRTPTADAKSYSVGNDAFNYNAPSGTLSAYPAVAGYSYIQMTHAAIGPLTGTDPEDCASTSSCSTGSSFSIQSINNRTKLYYNFGGTTGVREVVPGTATGKIDNFNPANMLIYAQSGGGTAGTPFAFTYSITDKANTTSPAVNYVITTTTPLPVTLIGFSAHVAGRNVLLTWSTASEKNNKGFAVERSFDAKSWKEVTFVTSKAVNGLSNEQLDYTATDKEVTPGNIYYRLKQLDYDGVSSLSEVRMVNLKNTGLSVYPNPASNVINVIGLSAKHTVAVSDLAGSVMMTADVDAHNNTINVASLPEGIYNVTIKTDSGVTSNFKLVKK
ncbi:MAG: T9SS type A sorting domain-containing protein [Sphingobacteriales bacterium]|nr:MAG: T9SS type A sorting domain-containing protein [Sphingobacteriales bacterium]